MTELQEVREIRKKTITLERRIQFLTMQREDLVLQMLNIQHNIV